MPFKVDSSIFIEAVLEGLLNQLKRISVLEDVDRSKVTRKACYSLEGSRNYMLVR